MTFVAQTLHATEEAVPLSPEQRLWRAVLSCAVRDLLNGGNRADAVKRWMLTRGKDEDYRWACDLADIDPDSFRRTAVRYIESVNGQLENPCAIDDVLLSKKPFSVFALGVPAHEVVERLKELQAEGNKFSRLNPGCYMCIGSNRPPPPPQPSPTPAADATILSGQEFDAGRNKSYLRYRIQYLRLKGYEITSLGRRKFICANPPDKSFTDAQSHPTISEGD